MSVMIMITEIMKPLCFSL